MVLWLRYIRAEDQPVEYVQQPVKSSSPNPDADVESTSEVALRTEDDDLAEVEEEFEEDEYDQIVEKIEEEPGNTLGNSNREENNGGHETLPTELSDEELANMDRNKAPLFHLVKAGETLYGISKKYEVPLNDILKINDLSIDEKISIGQKIYLRPPFEEIDDVKFENDKLPPDTYTTYTVKSGDTMYSISKKYNVSIDNILIWNNKTDSSIKEGEILKIKVSK